MKVSTTGLDIGKSTFHAVHVDARGKEVGRKKLTRSKVLAYFANRPAHLVGLEACAGSQWLARELESLGHTVKLMSARSVKAFVQGAKNDYNDARAIALAAASEGIRALRAKSVEQQVMQSLHRERQREVGERTKSINAMRALAMEFGVVLPKGSKVFRRELPFALEDACNGLPDAIRRTLWRQFQALAQCDERVAGVEAHIKELSSDSAPVKDLLTVPGIGFLTATAMCSSVGDGSQYRRGRDVSAALGLVPRQYSTGGKALLLGISKCGDAYLRYLLINGARAVLASAQRMQCAGKALCALRQWALRVHGRRGFNKAVVAVANRLARVCWAVLSSARPYDPTRLCAGAAR